MENFRGTINGVVFTDKEKFYEMLKKLRPEELQKVELEDFKKKCAELDKVEEKAPAKQKLDNRMKEELAENPVENQEDTDSYINGLVFGAALLYSLFKSFHNAMEGHNHVQPLSEEDQKKAAEVKRKVDFDDILSIFIMKPTTYKFTGEQIDELELDKFDTFLQSKIDSFKNVNFNGFTYEDFMKLREDFAKEFVKVTENIDKINKNLSELDVKMHKYEQIIELYSDLGKDVDELQSEYKDYSNQFNIWSNTVNYYRLLMNYYSYICHFIDLKSNEL